MRKNLLKHSLIAAALFCSNSLFAQITINQADYPFGQGQDAFSIHYSNGSDIELPKSGTGQVYDYSNLRTDEVDGIDYITGSGNSTFTSATSSIFREMTVSGFNFRAREYYRVDANGNSILGRTQFDTTHSIAMVTGNPDDIMHFIGADLPYIGEYNYLEFPVEYSKKWTGERIEITKIELTAAAFGLNKAPIEIKKRFNVTYEVIGSGTLNIPDENGNKSKDINVLAITVNETIIDSVFLGGAPAPKALLDAFGFTQGSTSFSSGIKFEMKGLGFSPLIIFYDQNNKPTRAVFRPRADKVTQTSTNELQELTTNVFPSITTSGSTLKIQNDNVQYNQIKLTDLAGKTYLIDNILSNQFILPIYLNSGIYFYEATSKNAIQKARGKLVISK